MAEVRLHAMFFWEDQMEKPKVLSIDIETFSDVDIGKCGVYKYCASENYHLLLFAYSVDYSPVRVIDTANGEVIPAEIIDWIYDPSVEKTAFNANFERTCLSKSFNRYCEPEQWNCTMVLAASCGLPMSLAGVGRALDLSEDKAKMKEGKDLIKYFCQPCRPTKVNGGRTRNMPWDAPEKWEVFKAYNQRDVETENTIRKMLLRWKPDYSEHKLWCIDQRMNDKGVRIEPKLAENAIRIGEAYREELLTKAKQLSGVDNPNSTAQIKKWLEESEGIEVESLNKKVLPDVYDKLDSDTTKEVLRLREEFSKSSTKKYEAFLRYNCADNHIRGTMQFYGASTGRFSSKGPQLQNVSHDTIPDLDTARELALSGDAIDFECLYPKVQKTLSTLIRTVLIPEEDSRFIVADFSAIEARVLAWVANEKWRLDAFRSGRDIYCESASRAFGIPVVKHGINGEYRKAGKVLELACISENELVLTDQGLVPIQDVTTDMKVWDGESWVEHEGVVYRGEKNVIEYEGLTATEDHLVYTEGLSSPVPFGYAARNGLHIISSGSGWGDAWRIKDRFSISQNPEWGHICSCWMRNLWEKLLEKTWRLKRQEKTFSVLPLLCGTSKPTSMDNRSFQSSKAKVREPKRCGIQKLWWAWHKVRLLRSNRSSEVYGRDMWPSEQGDGSRQDRQQRRLRTWKSSLGDQNAELSESKTVEYDMVGSKVLAVRDTHRESYVSEGENTGTNNRVCEVLRGAQDKPLAISKGTARVYDIRNAGRHHRFTVSGKLVHNCGYGGSVGSMKNFGADKLGMTEEEMVDLVNKWRSASPHIVALWKSLEESAINCIKTGKPMLSTVGSIRFDMEDGVLWMTLPSKRRIAYWGAAMGKDRWNRPSMTYMTVNQTTKRWERIETYGSRLVENACQAIARDCLKEALFHLVDAGYDPRVTIHDEVIITAPNGFGSLDEVIELMSKGAPWTEGLPLNAAGFVSDYYKKDD